jgi:hypothetical protein
MSKKKWIGIAGRCLLLVLFIGQIQAMADVDSTDMVILVDRSGSMKYEGGDPKGLSLAAVLYLLDQLELASESNRAALVLFKSNVFAIPDSGLSPDFPSIRSDLDKMVEVGGNTDLEEALIVGMRFLAQSRSHKQMVLISDGKPEPDFNSNRAAERFPDLLKDWRRAGNKEKKKAILEKVSQASTERIEKTLLGVMQEEQIELYPIALTGIQAYGEKLLKSMAIEVTKDSNAFRKLQARDLISGLDTIVPKPVSLMNIHRADLNNAGENRWTVDFSLDSPLRKIRILALYKDPPDDISWSLEGPAMTITPKNTGPARCIQARDENGAGRPIFERIFLNDPPTGNYRLHFESKTFLPLMQVVVEGRTGLRLTMKSDPQPGRVGEPITFFCRITGENTTTLQGATGSILNESGKYVKENIMFSAASGDALQALWTPFEPGAYRLHVKGFLDREQNRYLNTRYPFQVKPRQAIELQVTIPVRN